MKNLSTMLCLIMLCLCIFGCKDKKQIEAEKKHRQNVAKLVAIAEAKRETRKQNYLIRSFGNLSARRARKGIFKDLTPEERKKYNKQWEKEFEKIYKEQ